MNAPRRTIPVYFVIPGNAVLLDVVGPAEVFRSANLFAPESFDLHYCAPADELETGLAGLYLSRLAPLPEPLPAQAIVVLPGLVGDGPDWDDALTRAIVGWLRRLDVSGRIVMSVCAGALFAAAAGWLRGRECTTHHSCLTQLAALEPCARVHDNRIFVEDGPVFTSAGITAGIDLALHLVARLCGPQVASAAARHMVVYLRRAGQDPALSPWLEGRNHLHPVVHRVQDAILSDPAAAWPVERLATVAHTTSRHVSRLFAEHAQCTPMEYVYRIRLTLAQEMIRESRLNLEQIAERTGFGSAHHLRRVWRRHADGTPGELRQSKRR